MSNSTYFFFQAEDGIRDLVRSRGLGDVYKRQTQVARVMEGDPFPLEASSFHFQFSFLEERVDELLSLIHI